jgi:ATP-dependent RNA helicase RhlE
VRALIVGPTRELAMQVHESVKTYSKHLPLRSVCIYGGVDIKPQIAELREGREIVVATPGRLLDHVQQKSVHLRPGRDAGAGRSRPHARHGFHPRHQAHPRAAAARSGRVCCFRRPSRKRSRNSPTVMLKSPQLIEVARRNMVT